MDTVELPTEFKYDFFYHFYRFVDRQRERLSCIGTDLSLSPDCTLFE